MNIQAALDGVKDLNTKAILARVQGRARRTRTSWRTSTPATASSCPATTAVCNAYQKMKQVKGGKVITVDDEWITRRATHYHAGRAAPQLRRVLVRPLPAARPRGRAPSTASSPSAWCSSTARRRRRLRPRRGGDVHRLRLPRAAGRRGAAVPVGDPPARDQPRRRRSRRCRRSLVSLVYAAVLGLVMYWLIYRPLRSATALTRVCASVGTMLALQAIAVLNYGTTAKSTPTILPSEPLAHRAASRCRRTGCGSRASCVVLAAVLAAVYRFTRFGLATRASAENERGAALIGLSAEPHRRRQLDARDDARGHRRDPDRAGLDRRPDVVHAVHRPRARRRAGRALPRRSRSRRPPGLALGMLQSEITKLLTVWDWLPEQGVPQALPFVLIMIAMTLLARGVGARGTVGEPRNPSLGRPTRPYATTALCFVVGVIVLVLLHGSLRAAFIVVAGEHLPVAVARRAHRLRRPGVAGADVVRGPERVRAQPPRRRRGDPVPVRHCCSPR